MTTRRINWTVELPLFWKACEGDAPTFCFVVALRCTENGPRGNEFGVLSIKSVDTLEEELEVALTSLANAKLRAKAAGVIVTGPDGYLTEMFLRHFSKRWAPVGAENDPHHLNSHHAANLVKLYAVARVRLEELVVGLRL